MIIPVGKNDEAWKALLQDLSSLGHDDEIIFVFQENAESDFAREASALKISATCRWIQSSPGRAKQLNFGAKEATNENLWFLHCDSRISSQGIQNLKNAISKNSSNILFFNLKFLNDGSRLMSLNEIGGWVRSRILRLPFGDQGFCLSKTTFIVLGGFNENVPYGEDHVLIWKAHQKRIPIVCVGNGLRTSSRKYALRGWPQTTSRHVALTFRQALPELIKLLRDGRSR